MGVEGCVAPVDVSYVFFVGLVFVEKFDHADEVVFFLELVGERVVLPPVAVEALDVVDVERVVPVRVEQGVTNLNLNVRVVNELVLLFFFVSPPFQPAFRVICVACLCLVISQV